MPFESGQDASHISNQMNEWQKMQMQNMQRLDDVENDELGEDSQINGSGMDSQYFAAQSSQDFGSEGIRVS